MIQVEIANFLTTLGLDWPPSLSYCYAESEFTGQSMGSPQCGLKLTRAKRAQRSGSVLFKASKIKLISDITAERLWYLLGTLVNFSGSLFKLVSYSPYSRYTFLVKIRFRFIITGLRIIRNNFSGRNQRSIGKWKLFEFDIYEEQVSL